MYCTVYANKKHVNYSKNKLQAYITDITHYTVNDLHNLENITYCAVDELHKDNYTFLLLKKSLGLSSA